MKDVKRLFLAVSLLVLSSCASQFQVGLDHLNAKRYQSAIETFEACANIGDSNCMNNIGVMWSTPGALQGGPNTENAVYWFTLAARYGNPTAQQNLARLNQSIPRADLRPQPQPVQPTDPALIDAAGEFGKALGTLLGNM